MKKYRRTTGVSVYVQEDRYNDPEHTLLKRYNARGRPLGERFSHIDKSELVDELNQCKTIKGENNV